MYYYIYTTTNLINGKVYHGKHKTNNIDDGYLGSGTYLKRAIKKYGEENFNRVIRIFCRTEDIMNEMEEHLSYVEDWVGDKNCYNIKYGGQGGFDHITEEHREKARQSLIANPNVGGTKNWTEDSKRRATEQALLNLKNGACTTKGFKFSEESKQKMSESHRGMSNGKYGHVWCVKPDAINKVERIWCHPDAILEGWITCK